MSATDHRQIAEDGYTVLRGLLQPAEVSLLRQTILTYLRDPQHYLRLYEGRFKRDVFACERDELASLAAHPALAALGEIAASPVSFLGELGLYAEGTSSWHKDDHGLVHFIRGKDDDYGVTSALIYPQEISSSEEKGAIASSWSSRFLWRSSARSAALPFTSQLKAFWLSLFSYQALTEPAGIGLTNWWPQPRHSSW